MTKNEWKTNIKQLFLLFWKNFRLQLKSPVGLALEILVPAIFAFILLPIRSIVDSTLFENTIFFSPFKIEKLPIVFTQYTLVYHPNNSQFISDLIESVGSDLNLIPKGNRQQIFL